MATIKVMASAKFPHIKPAHHAFISKPGEGSNLDRAIRDAAQNIFKDERLKGMRANNILPVTITFTHYMEGSDD